MELYKNKDWLENQYINLEKSTYQIAREQKVGKSTIHRWVNKLKIPARPVGSRKGEMSSRWKGGKRINEKGYWMLYRPDHPSCRPDGYIKQARIRMEEKVNRYLSSNEIVHHRDLDKLNDNIENLQIMTASEHIKLHGRIKKTLEEVF